ncbi:uncharacterized protein MYCFIDRAFT_180278 [Pseudocercospora fijiensis CIRAD86]|uniref:Uncharacterized protein n=1 Tax=Pseudocercospora fijiensis (strain CIRAD86) TaxID=383855 RepID=M3AHY5_PSEFD|nr:uncharacterized protein MYCFIDRAFT_180278 [Pseudocercospora fijiensis CIRAD86]EME77122.1 hypothetical protein MYCFIDRAFT_180278 [Pseudocercospora fijiensis CIRAD86]
MLPPPERAISLATAYCEGRIMIISGPGLFEQRLKTCDWEMSRTRFVIHMHHILPRQEQQVANNHRPRRNPGSRHHKYMQLQLEASLSCAHSSTRLCTASRNLFQRSASFAVKAPTSLPLACQSSKPRHLGHLYTPRLHGLSAGISLLLLCGIAPKVERPEIDLVGVCKASLWRLEAGIPLEQVPKALAMTVKHPMRLLQATVQGRESIPGILKTISFYAGQKSMRNGRESRIISAGLSLRVVSVITRRREKKVRMRCVPKIAGSTHLLGRRSTEARLVLLSSIHKTLEASAKTSSIVLRITEESYANIVDHFQHLAQQLTTVVAGMCLQARSWNSHQSQMILARPDTGDNAGRVGEVEEARASVSKVRTRNSGSPSAQYQAVSLRTEKTKPEGPVEHCRAMDRPEWNRQGNAEAHKGLNEESCCLGGAGFENARLEAADELIKLGAGAEEEGADENEEQMKARRSIGEPEVSKWHAIAMELESPNNKMLIVGSIMLAMAMVDQERSVDEGLSLQEEEEGSGKKETGRPAVECHPTANDLVLTLPCRVVGPTGIALASRIRCMIPYCTIRDHMLLTRLNKIPEEEPRIIGTARSSRQPRRPSSTNDMRRLHSARALKCMPVAAVRCSALLMPPDRPPPTCRHFHDNEMPPRTHTPRSLPLGTRNKMFTFSDGHTDYISSPSASESESGSESANPSSALLKSRSPATVKRWPAKSSLVGTSSEDREQDGEEDEEQEGGEEQDGEEDEEQDGEEDEEQDGLDSVDSAESGEDVSDSEQSEGSAYACSDPLASEGDDSEHEADELVENEGNEGNVPNDNDHMRAGPRGSDGYVYGNTAFSRSAASGEKSVANVRPLVPFSQASANPPALKRVTFQDTRSLPKRKNPLRNQQLTAGPDRSEAKKQLLHHVTSKSKPRSYANTSSSSGMKTTSSPLTSPSSKRTYELHFQKPSDLARLKSIFTSRYQRIPSSGAGFLCGAEAMHYLLASKNHQGITKTSTAQTIRNLVADHGSFHLSKSERYGDDDLRSPATRNFLYDQLAAGLAQYGNYVLGVVKLGRRGRRNWVLLEDQRQNVEDGDGASKCKTSEMGFFQTCSVAWGECNVDGAQDLIKEHYNDGCRDGMRFIYRRALPPLPLFLAGRSNNILFLNFPRVQHLIIPTPSTIEAHAAPRTINTPPTPLRTKYEPAHPFLGQPRLRSHLADSDDTRPSSPASPSGVLPRLNPEVSELGNVPRQEIHSGNHQLVSGKRKFCRHAPAPLTLTCTHRTAGRKLGDGAAQHNVELDFLSGVGLSDAEISAVRVERGLAQNRAGGNHSRASSRRGSRPKFLKSKVEKEEVDVRVGALKTVSVKKGEMVKVKVGNQVTSEVEMRIHLKQEVDEKAEVGKSAGQEEKSPVYLKQEDSRNPSCFGTRRVRHCLLLGWMDTTSRVAGGKSFAASSCQHRNQQGRKPSCMALLYLHDWVVCETARTRLQMSRFQPQSYWPRRMRAVQAVSTSSLLSAIHSQIINPCFSDQNNFHQSPRKRASSHTPFSSLYCQTHRVRAESSAGPRIYVLLLPSSSKLHLVLPFLRDQKQPAFSPLPRGKKVVAGCGLSQYIFSLKPNHSQLACFDGFLLNRISGLMWVEDELRCDRQGLLVYIRSLMEVACSVEHEVLGGGRLLGLAGSIFCFSGLLEGTEMHRGGSLIAGDRSSARHEGLVGFGNEPPVLVGSMMFSGLREGSEMHRGGSLIAEDESSARVVRTWLVPHSTYGWLVFGNKSPELAASIASSGLLKAPKAHEGGSFALRALSLCSEVVVLGMRRSLIKFSSDVWRYGNFPNLDPCCLLFITFFLRNLNQAADSSRESLQGRRDWHDRAPMVGLLFEAPDLLILCTWWQNVFHRILITAHSSAIASPEGMKQGLSEVETVLVLLDAYICDNAKSWDFGTIFAIPTADFPELQLHCRLSIVIQGTMAGLPGRRERVHTWVATPYQYTSPSTEDGQCSSEAWDSQRRWVEDATKERMMLRETACWRMMRFAYTWESVMQLLTTNRGAPKSQHPTCLLFLSSRSSRVACRLGDDYS